MASDRLLFLKSSCQCTGGCNHYSKCPVVTPPLFGLCTTGTRGSHLYVPYRNVCDRDQNRIKRSKHFLRADQGIKGTSELRKSGKNVWLQFASLTRTKSSDQGPQKGQSSDQAHFLPIKNLDRGCKRFNRRHSHPTTPTRYRNDVPVC